MTALRTPALALATTLAAGGVAGNPIDQIRPDAPELAPYGPLPIGVQTLEVTIPDSVDVLNVDEGVIPRYDRPLTLEVWYPAAEGTEQGGSYTAMLRDGATEVTLTGRAARDATPASGTRYPLVIISHGYPGNRYLMSHLGENLASKGYVTVSIDHTDSLYSDQAAFGSTLYNRPLDQAFVLDHMAGLDGPIGDIIDAENTGVIGYSMGGYGALIFGGAGVTQASTEFSWGAPNGLLETHLEQSESHEALMDSRVKAIVAIGPWGNNAGFWDASGVADLRIPTLFMAGSDDDVSVYDAMRAFFAGAEGTDRHLLTFDYANHNAAAPMPAPIESWEPVEGLEFAPFDHYADAVWDTTRMNNIAQHFATAFFALHLKEDAEKAEYLELVPNAADGIVAVDDAGEPTEDHTYWKGFAPRTAKGLRFETLPKGQ
ncbi:MULTISPECIES: dienelactone hydrolase [Roseobacteraceae]|uniref:alpha/beta hydrolase family protein n=1 Tax=Roseobacteraceae TaxID=2854170 RepID=UPI001C451DB6|nr:MULTISPECIES: dienelactone hydrolase [Roseobacteraceae]MBV7408905.1 dienelactone hydrolase [Maritimibacter sp. DP1N21-5]MBY5934408.1 dienelactone hydrolase [Tateyamaria omphalii]